jgi:hypothetical protein
MVTLAADGLDRMKHEAIGRLQRNLWHHKIFTGDHIESLLPGLVACQLERDVTLTLQYFRIERCGSKDFTVYDHISAGRERS